MLKEKRNLRNILAAAFLIGFILLLICFSRLCSAEQAFLKLANTYFNSFYFPSNPIKASGLGIHLYDTQLEDFSKEALDKQIAGLKKYQDLIENIDRNALTEPLQGDYDLLLHSIKSQLLTLEVIKPWEKNPDLYSSEALSSIFDFISRQFAPLDKRLELLIAREQRIPVLLAQARKNLKNPPRIYTEIAIEKLPRIIHFFQEDVPKAFAASKNPALKKQLDASNATVIQALQEYQQWIQTTLLAQSHGDFRIGAENFRKKLWYDEMVKDSLDDLIALDLDDMQHNQKEFARIAKLIEPNKTPAQVLAMMNRNHPSADDLLKSFENTFDDLIHFIKTKNIISLPSQTRPILQETPPFLRATTFASMDTPGPYEKVAKEAYFNVTLPDKTWEKQKIEEFMQTFSYPVISSISVHEAYPGHFVQFLWKRTIKDPVRRIIGANSNTEGWAHYCEQMILDEGYAADKDERSQHLLRLGQLLEALLRNARFIVGIKMHTGEMSFDDAVAYLEKEGYQSHTSALIEAKRGTYNPTYLYYTLGKLEILKLRKELELKEGKAFNLKKFHDDFMRQGFPPIPIVRRALLNQRVL